jgi:hypothetical protein
VRERALWLQCGALLDFYQDSINPDDSTFLSDIMAVNGLCLDVLWCTNTCSNVHARLYCDVLPVCGSVKGQESMETMELRQRAALTFSIRYGLTFNWQSSGAEFPDYSSWDV